MKTFWALPLLAFVTWLDFPERWNAELSGARPAIVHGYTNEGTWKRPWKIQIKTEDGAILTSGDNWMFRYLDIGDKTEWTSSRQTFVGNFFLRWMLYLIGGPIVLAGLAHDILEVIKRHKKK